MSGQSWPTSKPPFFTVMAPDLRAESRSTKKLYSVLTCTKGTWRKSGEQAGLDAPLNSKPRDFSEAFDDDGCPSKQLRKLTPLCCSCSCHATCGDIGNRNHCGCPCFKKGSSARIAPAQIAKIVSNLGLNNDRQTFSHSW